jgi:outer membrane receptor protein involved in Fe transport
VFAVALAVLGTQTNPEGLELPTETPADRVPPPQGTLGLWVDALDDLHAEAFASGALRQDRLNDPTNLDDNRIPEGGTPGYVTVHARLAWRASRELTMRLALDNVTNQLVLEHGSGYFSPGLNAMLGADFVVD